MRQHPKIERLLAEMDEQDRRKQWAQFAIESAQARDGLAACLLTTAELARRAEKVAAKRIARDLANDEYVAEAAALENEQSNLTFRLMHYHGEAKRTKPEILVQAITSIEEQLATEQARDIPPDPATRAAHTAVVNSLFNARDSIEALAAVDPALIPTRLAEIQATILSPVIGVVPGRTWVEEQADRIRQWKDARFRGETI
jgi:hypothetical protein